MRLWWLWVPAFAGTTCDGEMSLSAETIIQSLASGLLMGLLYGLIAVGLALIFGLMDVVNFAHGEFLMIAMYATFFLFAFFALDPLLAAPLVAASLFVFGAVVYLLIVRFAMRAKANAGMVQIFSTFGLAIVMRGLAQFFFTPDYRSITHSWLGGKTVSIGGIFLPEPQLMGALVSIVAFAGLYFFINRTDFGRALEATREDNGAVALVGIDKNRVFALGWGLGAALVGLRCRRLVRADRLCHGRARRLRLSVRRLCRRHRRWPRRGDDRAGAAALAEIGRHLRGISLGRLHPAARPVRVDLMDKNFAERRRRELMIAGCLAVVATLVPLFVKDVYVQNIMVLTLMYAALSQSWNILSGYCGQISLGHALYFGLGAYTTALLFTKFGVLPWFGMLGGGVISAAIAMALGYPCFRLRGHYFVIATIVIAEIALLLFQNWDWAGAALGIDIPVRGDSWLKFQFTRSKLPYFYFALVLAAVAWFVTWWLEDSKWGYWWRAVKDNPDAAESLGVVVFNSKMGAAAVSAFLVAVGGGFYAQFVSYIDPESVMGFQFSLLMALPAVLGGIGTLWGPMLGAVILIPLTELTRSFIGGSGRGVDLIAYGTLIVLISLARPQGLVGLFSRQRKAVAP
jgi:branched-chain amino acid transport system permease protein